MKRPVPRKCLNCKKFFLPDYRNQWHQKYCTAEACQRESHRVAQAKLRGSAKGMMSAKDRADEVERVRQWRARRKESREREAVLRDDCLVEVVDTQNVVAGTVMLRDDCLEQNPLIIGLIAQVSGVLRDDIEPVLKSLHSRGQMILGKGPGIVSQN